MCYWNLDNISLYLFYSFMINAILSKDTQMHLRFFPSLFNLICHKGSNETLRRVTACLDTFITSSLHDVIYLAYVWPSFIRYSNSTCMYIKRMQIFGIFSNIIIYKMLKLHFPDILTSISEQIYNIIIVTKI